MLRYKIEIRKGEKLVKSGVIQVSTYAELNEMMAEVCNMGPLWSVDEYPCNDESLKAQEDFMESHCINKI